MSSRKWGESFLKSGLPLEHLTAVTLKAAGWHLEQNIDYQRLSQGEAEAWFELDLFASKSCDRGDTEIGLLVECKYHDTSRFWMFLPLDGNLGWMSDDAFLNCGPVQTLCAPRASTISSLAPLSGVGVVLSEDGTKQDNALHTASQQLAHAFVPYAGRDRLYDFNFEVAETSPIPFWATAVVPTIVTNASLFRLRPDVTDLETIRRASQPTDIADEVAWTWCRYEAGLPHFREQLDNIDAHILADAARFEAFPLARDRFRQFAGRPHWIAVVNIKALESFASSLEGALNRLRTHSIKSLLKRQTSAKRRSRKT